MSASGTISTTERAQARAARTPRVIGATESERAWLESADAVRSPAPPIRVHAMRRLERGYLLVGDAIAGADLDPSDALAPMPGERGEDSGRNERGSFVLRLSEDYRLRWSRAYAGLNLHPRMEDDGSVTVEIARPGAGDAEERSIVSIDLEGRERVLWEGALVIGGAESSLRRIGGHWYAMGKWRRETSRPSLVRLRPGATAPSWSLAPDSSVGPACGAFLYAFPSADGGLVAAGAARGELAFGAHRRRVSVQRCRRRTPEERIPYHAFWVRTDAGGRVTRLSSFEGPGKTVLGSAALGPAGELYLAGTARGEVDFDPGPAKESFEARTPAGHGFVTRIEADGTPAFTRVFFGDEWISSVLALPDGVIVKLGAGRIEVGSVVIPGRDGGRTFVELDEAGELRRALAPTEVLRWTEGGIFCEATLPGGPRVSFNTTLAGCFDRRRPLFEVLDDGAPPNRGRTPVGAADRAVRSPALGYRPASERRPT